MTGPTEKKTDPGADPSAAYAVRASPRAAASSPAMSSLTISSIAPPTRLALFGSESHIGSPGRFGVI